MTSQPPKPPRVKIRKIFKKGDSYICGLCGKTYADIPSVQACLASCTKEFLSEGETVEAPQKRYRCSYCKRVHNSIEEAQSCSLQCKQKIEYRTAAERSALTPASIEEKLKALAQFAKDPGASQALKTVQAQQAASAASAAPVAPKVLGVYKKKSTEILAGENVKFMRDKNMFRCLKCKQRYHGAVDARSCFDAHSENYVAHTKPKSTDARYTLDGKKFRCSKCERLYGQVEDVIKCHESHEVIAVGRNGKEPDNAAYYRDGAKYVCRTCGKKYFSREEVQQCFDSPHPETIASPALESAPLDPAPAPEARIDKKDDAAKFYRDGAKYVCRGCGKKYFSRDETLTCFAGDADKPEL